jgi:hypothetical protein
MTYKPLSSWRWRITYMAFSVGEGIVIALAAKRPIVLVVCLCLVLAAIRLSLEALRS